MIRIDPTQPEPIIQQPEQKKSESSLLIQLKEKKIGLLIITLSAFTISAPLPLYIKKIGLTTLMIGLFWTLFLEEKNLLSFNKLIFTKTTKNLHIIFIVILLWILLAYLLTSPTDIELFFILSFIGILLIKEFTTKYLTNIIKRRFNYLIIGFFIFFCVIVINKILTI